MTRQRRTVLLALTWGGFAVVCAALALWPAFARAYSGWLFAIGLTAGWIARGGFRR